MPQICFIGAKHAKHYLYLWPRTPGKNQPYYPNQRRFIHSNTTKKNNTSTKTRTSRPTDSHKKQIHRSTNTNKRTQSYTHTRALQAISIEVGTRWYKYSTGHCPHLGHELEGASVPNLLRHRVSTAERGRRIELRRRPVLRPQ